MNNVSIDGYLLDTCFLSALLDPTKGNHSTVCQVIDDLDDETPKYVSVITFAELQFGIRLATLRRNINTQRLEQIIFTAKRTPLSMLRGIRRKNMASSRPSLPISI